MVFLKDKRYIKKYKKKSEDRYKEILLQNSRRYSPGKNKLSSSTKIRKKFFANGKKKIEDGDYKSYLKENFKKIKKIFLKDPYNKNNNNFKITNTCTKKKNSES